MVHNRDIVKLTFEKVTSGKESVCFCSRKLCRLWHGSRLSNLIRFATYLAFKLKSIFSNSFFVTAIFKKVWASSGYIWYGFNWSQPFIEVNSSEQWKYVKQCSLCLTAFVNLMHITRVIQNIFVSIVDGSACVFERRQLFYQPADRPHAGKASSGCTSYCF